MITITDAYNKKYQYISLTLLILGLILRICYAIKVPYNISSHDMGVLGVWDIRLIDPNASLKQFGHLNYIQYIYMYHRLPPTFWGQFYHPPFFHILGAFVVRFFHHFGCSYEECLEYLQIENMLFASMPSFIIYSFLKKTNVYGIPMIAAVSIVSFHPVFYNIGAALNNDALSTTLGIAAVYFLSLWIQNTQFHQIIFAALCLGFGMFTKLSVALVAPSTAVIFLYKLVYIIRNKNTSSIKPVHLFLQFVLFSLICLPIGLYWSVHNYIEYGLPVNYVPQLSEKDPQYIGNVPNIKRLLLPSKEQLFSVKLNQFSESQSNIWGQTFMTEAFDEGVLDNEQGTAHVFSVIFLWTCAFMFWVMCILSLYGVFCEKKIIDIKLFMLGIFLTYFIFYIKFCFDYPFVCTMNFRYLSISFCILTILYAIGCHIEKNSHPMMVLLEKISYTGVIIQSVLGAGLYLFCS